jgi:Nucleotidyltransferase domain
LTSAQSLVAQRRIEIYLQGSYRNATNTFGDSDVDIVVELRSVFSRDVSSLPPDQIAFQIAAHPGGVIYDWPEFRADVLRTLQNYYGTGRVRDGDKCIKVNFGAGRIAADVVPAVTHQKYSYFYNLALQGKTDGISFRNRAGTLIANFPKQHIENGQAKNSATITAERYKPTVRVFKNLRNRLVADNAIGASTASSYCVECLLYNAEDSCFAPTFQETFTNIMASFRRKPAQNFISQSGISPLFGNSPVQWNPEDAVRFLTAAQRLWDNWR